jgi:hypothetical protein
MRGGAPRGNIGASRNGGIGETPYEYLRGNSPLGAKHSVLGGIGFRVQSGGRVPEVIREIPPLGAGFLNTGT